MDLHAAARSFIQCISGLQWHPKLSLGARASSASHAAGPLLKRRTPGMSPEREQDSFISICCEPPIPGHDSASAQHGADLVAARARDPHRALRRCRRRRNEGNSRRSEVWLFRSWASSSLSTCAANKICTLCSPEGHAAFLNCNENSNENIRVWFELMVEK